MILEDVSATLMIADIDRNVMWVIVCVWITKNEPRKSPVFETIHIHPGQEYFLQKKAVEFRLMKTTKSILRVKFQWSLVGEYAVSGYVVVKIWASCPFKRMSWYCPLPILRKHFPEYTHIFC